MPGEGAVIHHQDLMNLYGPTIGAASRVGTFVEQWLRQQRGLIRRAAKRGIYEVLVLSHRVVLRRPRS